LTQYDVKEVFLKDYEPYASKRDAAICELLEANHVVSYLFKDQVIFEEITKADGLPYTVYTP
jgi:deoxyribodipyrimidine photo-lyase